MKRALCLSSTDKTDNIELKELGLLEIQRKEGYWLTGGGRKVAEHLVEIERIMEER